MVWDEDTIRHLRELWAQGLSTAEIGRRLGVSKNAIVGKAHRLDLDARPSPIRRESGKGQTERTTQRVAGPTLPPLASTNEAAPRASATVLPLRPVLVEARKEPVQPRPVATAAPISAVPISAVPVSTVPVSAPPRPAASAPVRRSAPACCWPIGEPGTRSFRFCDDASLPGKPYCDEHAKLAYVKVKDRKEDAA